MFVPDFNSECQICGNSPTVMVPEHQCPDTNLCGVCFFSDLEMLDWSLWNEFYQQEIEE